MRVALLLWICTTVHTSGSDHTSCPANCLCVINDHTAQTVDIECRDQPSTNIQLPLSVTSLTYYNISTQLLKSSNLFHASSDGSEITKIIYKNSGIKSVQRDTFLKVPGLEYLDLSRNMLTEIEDNILHPLYFQCQNLNHLDLSLNEISFHKQTDMNPSLVVLLLNDNNITAIPRNMFDNLKNLKILNLANNKIHILPDGIFLRLIALENLDLKNNEIVHFLGNSFKGTVGLQNLNISKNPIRQLDDSLLQNNVDLHVLDASDTNIYQISGKLLSHLKRLKELNLNNNKQLAVIEDFKFKSSNHLQYIDLRFGNLTSVPKFILHLDMIEQLRLEGNPWSCACTSAWFPKWLADHRHAVNSSLKCDGSEHMVEVLSKMGCMAPEAVNNTLYEVLELRSNIILTCLFIGYPEPSITWLTPSGYIFHYYPNNNTKDIYSNHSRVHLYNLEPAVTYHIKLLNNGSLEIKELLRQDAGNYTCIAFNSLGNATSQIVVTLNRETFYHIKIMCIIVGASCVAAILLCTVIGQIIYWACKKCGWVDERGKQLMQLRENLEVYKSQQLQSLRENYTQQVHRIKENCAFQVEWIRDSYRGQVKHIRDFKHYGSHQFSSIRDQYYDQMKRVRDYSTTQLGWVRENYVFQRNRIHKFSSHQVLRFRESYKYQQQAMNKLLENLPSLNLDNCRGSSCGRSESSLFMDNMDDMEVQNLDVLSKTVVEEMTEHSVLEDAVDEQSVYYTPTELSDSPISPTMEPLFNKRDLLLGPEALDLPSTSCATIPWLQDSPCHVFHCSQVGILCPVSEDFQVPRTLQSSTSLPEMPQVYEGEGRSFVPRPELTGPQETEL